MNNRSTNENTAIIYGDITFSDYDFIARIEHFKTTNEINRASRIAYNARMLLSTNSLPDVPRRLVFEILYKFTYDYSYYYISSFFKDILAEGDFEDIAFEAAYSLSHSNKFLTTSFPHNGAFCKFIKTVSRRRFVDYLRKYKLDKIPISADTANRIISEDSSMAAYIKYGKHGTTYIYTFAHEISLDAPANSSEDSADTYNYYAHTASDVSPSPEKNALIKNEIVERFHFLVGFASGKVKSVRSKLIRIITIMTIINDSINASVYLNINIMNTKDTCVCLNERAVLITFLNFLKDLRSSLTCINFSIDEILYICNIDIDNLNPASFDLDTTYLKELISKDKRQVLEKDSKVAPSLKL